MDRRAVRRVDDDIAGSHSTLEPWHVGRLDSARYELSRSMVETPAISHVENQTLMMNHTHTVFGKIDLHTLLR